MADNELLQIGEHTYGRPLIHRWATKDPVIIGKYCSIASNVHFYIDGNHRYDRASTYPFAELEWLPKTKETANCYGNGPIVIGNDVWIGASATIMSGVSVGDGAVIANQALVTKDVEPYSIVAGNPARLVKYRFEEPIRKELLELKWWDLPTSVIKKNIQIFHEPIEVFLTEMRKIRAVATILEEFTSPPRPVIENAPELPKIPPTARIKGSRVYNHAKVADAFSALNTPVSLEKMGFTG